MANWTLQNKGYVYYDAPHSGEYDAQFRLYDNYQATFTVEPGVIYRYRLLKNNNGYNYANIPLEISSTANRDTVNVWLSTSSTAYNETASKSGYTASNNCWVNTNSTKISIADSARSTEYYLYLALDNISLTQTKTITLNIKQKFWTDQGLSNLTLGTSSSEISKTFPSLIGQHLYRFKLTINSTSWYSFKNSLYQSTQDMWISESATDYSLYTAVGGGPIFDSQERIIYDPSRVYSVKLTKGKTYYLYILCFYKMGDYSTQYSNAGFSAQKTFWDVTIADEENLTSTIDSHVYQKTITLGPEEIYVFPFKYTTSNRNLLIWSESENNADVVGWFKQLKYYESPRSYFNAAQETNSSSTSGTISDDNSGGNNQFQLTIEKTSQSQHALYISPKDLNCFNGQNKEVTFYIGRIYQNFIQPDTSIISLNSNEKNINLSYEANTIYQYKFQPTITANYAFILNKYFSFNITNESKSNGYYQCSPALTTDFPFQNSKTILLTANQVYYFNIRVPSSSSSGDLTINIKQQYWQYQDLNQNLTITDPLRELNFNISPGIIYHLSFKIKNSTYYTPLSISSISNNTTKPDLVGWICTNDNIDTHYNLYQAANSMSLGTYSDDNSNNNKQFKIDLGTINDTNYRHLYFSSKAYNTSFEENQPITIVIKNPTMPTTWNFEARETLNNNYDSIITLQSRTIYRHKFTVTTSKNYNFYFYNSKHNIVAWISDSKNAYNTQQIQNSKEYGKFETFKGTPNISTPLFKDQTYYFYYSSANLYYDYTDNVRLYISNSPLESSYYNLGNTIYASSFYNQLVQYWNSLCSTRKYYGNISSRKGALNNVNKGTQIEPNNLPDIISEFNNYFYTPVITIVNQGQILSADIANHIASRFDEPGSCKIACTGLCTSTNSHKSDTTVSFSCSQCDTSCSTGCAMTACKGGCWTSCDGGCDGDCKSACSASCEIGSQGQSGTISTSNCSECAAACTLTCENSCNTFCGNTCSGSCGKSTCQDNCAGNCGAGCTQGCAIGCQLGCGDNCSNDCYSWCWSEATATYSGCLCSGYCDSLCGSRVCGGSCTGDCANQCSGNCEDRCRDECIGSCSSECFSCTDVCSGTCSSCTNSCSKNSSGSTSTVSCDSCDNGCGTGCQSGCLGDCLAGCHGDCKGGCQKECKTTCGDTSCSLQCSAQTSGGTSTAYGDCHENCTDGCATSCNNYCIVTNQQ